MNNQELIVLGLEDGTVQVYDYTGRKDQGSYKREMFSVEVNPKTGAKSSKPSDLDHPYDNFKQTIYAHRLAITTMK